MKPTGIVRRIDELGRVVIPKEVRRTMHIREGAPLEIFTDCDGVYDFKGDDCLPQILSKAKHSSAQSVLTALLTAVQQNGTTGDDLTICVLHFY